MDDSGLRTGAAAAPVCHLSQPCRSGRSVCVVPVRHRREFGSCRCREFQGDRSRFNGVAPDRHRSGVISETGGNHEIQRKVPRILDEVTESLAPVRLRGRPNRRGRRQLPARRPCPKRGGGPNAFREFNILRMCRAIGARFVSPVSVILPESLTAEIPEWPNSTLNRPPTVRFGNSASTLSANTTRGSSGGS